MEKTTSGIVESGESSGPDVTIIETVTVCTIDRRKSGNQIPKCTVKRVRVLNSPPRELDAEPSEINESLTPGNEDDQTGSAVAKNEQVCPIPSKEMTMEEQESAALDCLSKAYDREVGVTPAPEQSDPHARKRFKRKGD
jgi:hypothetical protein